MRSYFFPSFSSFFFFILFTHYNAPLLCYIIIFSMRVHFVHTARSDRSIYIYNATQYKYNVPTFLLFIINRLLLSAPLQISFVLQSQIIHIKDSMTCLYVNRAQWGSGTGVTVILVISYNQRGGLSTRSCYQKENGLIPKYNYIMKCKLLVHMNK